MVLNKFHTDPAYLLPAVSEPFVCGVQNCKFRRKQRHPVKAINRKFVGIMGFMGFILVANEQSDIYQRLVSTIPSYFVLRLIDQTGKMGDGAMVVAIMETPDWTVRTVSNRYSGRSVALHIEPPEIRDMATYRCINSTG
jgi:hypothetical protein